MRIRFSALAHLLAATTLLVAAHPVLAQENQELGRMWTFENPPLAHLEKEYGFKPDKKWLDSLRLAALRLGGESSGFCSASFVSPQGLIMTNNHCVRDAVNATREAGPDMVKSGYYASSLEEEIRLRVQNDGWLRVSQLNKVTDVTARVNEGITSSDDDAEIKKKREANKEKIISEAKEKDAKLVPQVVSLYQGGIFQLYQYKVYDDLRLVCTPHLQTAHFGGDPDNFTYPRYSIDFAFLRAYEDGKPADTSKHYYKWKAGGATDGELVFVPGNPGSTDRLNTKAQMDYKRDVEIPIILELLTNRLRIFRGLIKRFPQLEDQVRTQMLSWENGEKAFTGNLNGLNDSTLMAQKTAAEKAFKKRVLSNEKIASKYGDLWDRIAVVAKARRENNPKTMFHSTGYLNSLKGAVELVRGLDPDTPEEDRKEALAGLERMRLSDDPISQSLFIDHVERANKWLDEDDPYFTKVLQSRDGREALSSLRRSKVADPGFRGKLIEGGWKAVQESEDPAIRAARDLVPLMRAHEEQEKELDAKEEALGAEIGRALFATYGTNVSPDATMTPRFTDGLVKGFKFNGTIAPYRTSFYGLYARNAEFDNVYPFSLPPIWLERKDKVDMTKSVNFVSTNDITGGNSGSVVVNKELECVGLIFDGNIESLHNDFVFRDDVPRSVSVHVDGIMEAMEKIYEADRVVKELKAR